MCAKLRSAFHTGQKRRLLVADDDPRLLELMTVRLVDEETDVICAEHGAAARDLLVDEDFDLAIIDLLMPVLTGFELIDYMRGEDNFKGIPLIAITGFASSYEQLNKVKEACDAVVLKGEFEIAGFLETVAGLLN